MTMAEIVLAGVENSASTLCWTLLHLIHNPGVQEMLHQELDRVIGPNRSPELKDKESLPCLEATITEVLRMSTDPFVIHKTTVNTLLQGCHIPKDTTLLINLWSLHHNPQIWDSPNDFRPPRFLDKDGNFVPPTADRFHPFSAGRRGCFGETLARMELQAWEFNRMWSAKFTTHRRTYVEAATFQDLCHQETCQLTFTYSIRSLLSMW